MENKTKKDFSIHNDPHMKWECTHICADCLNYIPHELRDKPRACDVFDNIEDVNNAIEINECKFYIKK